MPTTLWSVDFNAGTTAEKAAKAAKFYQTPRNGLGVPGRLSIANAPDGVTGLCCGWGVPANNTQFFDTHAAMNATSPANGATANCYDADPALHGYYLRTGGAWARQGRVLDQPWFDPNHVSPAGAALALWIQAWGQNAAGTGAQSSFAPPGYNGWPYSEDLRGLELHARMRALDLKMPRDHKLVQHFQTQSLTSGPLGGGRTPFVNACQIRDPYSDALKFGRGGYYAPNPAPGVFDSGWVDVVIPLSTLDSDWKQLGATDQRAGLTGTSSNPVVYVVEGPGDFLQAPGGLGYNAYIVSTQPVTNYDSSVTFPASDSFAGQLLVQSFSLVDPS